MIREREPTESDWRPECRPIAKWKTEYKTNPHTQNIKYGQQIVPELTEQCPKNSLAVANG